MTDYKNNKPQSLDEYFARAKKSEKGMSAKQVSDLITTAQAGKLSWLAYVKPFASKLNSIIFLSALTVGILLFINDDYLSSSDNESTSQIDINHVEEAKNKKAEIDNKPIAENQNSKLLATKESNYEVREIQNTRYLSKTVNQQSVTHSPKSNQAEETDLAAVYPSKQVTVIYEMKIDHNVAYYPIYEEEHSIFDDTQIEEGFESLAGNNQKNAYFIQTDTRFSQTSLDQAVFVGGKIAWMPTDNLSFGFAGYGLTNKPIIDIVMEDQSVVDGHLYVGYGGFFMEYTFIPKELIHFYIGTFFGLGGIHAAPVENNTDAAIELNNGIIWLVEPNAGVELNVTSFLKVGVDISYRYSELNAKDKFYRQSPGLTNFDMNGFSTGLFVKLGLF